MRIFFITLSLVSFMLIAPSCKKATSGTAEPEIEILAENEDDIDDFGLEESDSDSIAIDSTLNSETIGSEKKVFTSEPNKNANAPTQQNQQATQKQPVKIAKTNVVTSNPSNAGQLKKYSVVVSTLSKQDGVDKLSKSLDKTGINYFVVKSGGLFMFVVASSDSEADAIKARKDFLLKTTLDKSRQQIWNDYEIEVTDAYILEKK